MAISPLRNYRILIVDADAELARVLRQMLAEMGFVNSYVTNSGRDAINKLREAPYDFIITEWNTQHMDGMEMLRFIRRDKKSPCPTIPIIMLTGRAEQSDVRLARDYGINEYVVKPFTAKTIYSRLERLIEQPRQFVMSEGFVGPDRRVRGEPPAGVSERREARAPKMMQASDALKELHKGDDWPKIFTPDFSLKMKLGKLKLQDLITPDVLNQAQEAINAIASDSLVWIRNDLNALSVMMKSMMAGQVTPTLVSEMQELALSIKSRSGTFGFSRAAEIAYTLYLFARGTLDPANKGHHIVVQKHVEVLYIILGNQMTGDAGDIGAQVMNELRALSKKYSAA